MASKIKVDQIQTADGTGTIALQNQLSGMTDASMPAGSALQVVQFSNLDMDGHQSTTSTSYVDSGFSQAITPKRNNSKIIVDYNASMCHSDSTNGELLVTLKINGSSWSGLGTYALGYQYKPAGVYYGMHFTGTYTVSSLSTLTFSVWYRSADGGSVRLAHDESSLAITLTEVAQ